MLQLSATNLDMGINMWIAGTVEAEGSTTVAARVFADFVNAAKSEKTTIELDGTVVRVSTESSQATFQTIAATEFPILPKPEADPVMSIQAESFGLSLDKVMFACSTDSAPGKTQQTGVFFKLSNEDNVLTLVGLDGYRLSEKKLNIKRNSLDEFEAIVPAKALVEMVRVIQSEDVDMVDVHVNESKTQIIFKFNEVEFSVRLLEGPYPDYQQVIPEGEDYTFLIDKNSLEDAIKVINTFARSVLGNRTNFDADPDAGELTLSSSIVDLGDNETKIKILEPVGGKLHAAYNLRYLSEMAAAMESEHIKFQTKSPLSAAVFNDPDDPDFIHLIMPLRRSD